MASAGTTQYQVDIVYDLKGNAQQGLQRMGNEAARATSVMGGLKGALAAVGAGTLFHLGKKYLVDFNSEVQRLKIGLATVTAMNLHVPFSRAAVEADKMWDVFQKMAITSPNTTKEFVDMANMISSSVLQAGLGIKGLENMTKGAMTASNALGGDPSEMATGIQHALSGSVNIRDKYVRQILAGVGQTDYKKFNKLGSTQRANIVQKAFDQQPLKDAADAMGNSFQGVVSTFKDNLEIALGQVGLPLMKSLTAEIKSWTQWIADNPVKIQHMITTLGDGIKDAFSVVRDVFGFITGHADIMLEIGKVWAMTRIGGGIGGMMGGLGGLGGGGVMGAIGGGIGGGLGNMGALLAEGFGTRMRSGALSLALRAPELVGPMNSLNNFASKLGGMAGSVGSTVGGAFSSVGGGIGVGGMVTVGLVAHELGEYLGVHRAITAVIDPMKDKYIKLQEQMAKFDDAMVDAAHRLENVAGAGGSMFGKQQAGGLDIKRQKAELAGDYARTGNEDPLRESGLFGPEELGTKGMAKFRIGDSNSYDAGAWARQYQDSYQHDLGIKTASQFDADTSITSAILSMTDAQKAGVDTAKGTNDLLMEYTRRMAAGNYGMMSVADVIKYLMDHDKNDLPNAPKPAQTNVTINKIEVYSDDPDRFVAGAVMAFDEVTKNPTQAHEIMRGAF